MTVETTNVKMFDKFIYFKNELKNCILPKWTDNDALYFM